MSSTVLDDDVEFETEDESSEYEEEEEEEEDEEEEEEEEEESEEQVKTVTVKLSSSSAKVTAAATSSSTISDSKNSLTVEKTTPVTSKNADSSSTVVVSKEVEVKKMLVNNVDDGQTKLKTDGENMKSPVTVKSEPIDAKASLKLSSKPSDGPLAVPTTVAANASAAASVSQEKPLLFAGSYVDLEVNEKRESREVVKTAELTSSKLEKNEAEDLEAAPSSKRSKDKNKEKEADKNAEEGRDGEEEKVKEKEKNKEKDRKKDKDEDKKTVKGTDYKDSENDKEKDKKKEKKKSKEESNSFTFDPTVDDKNISDDAILSSKESFKSKKEKISDEDASTIKKKDKSSDADTESGIISKGSKKDKTLLESSPKPEPSVELQFIGEVSPPKEKSKSSRKKYSADAAEADDGSQTLPSEKKKKKETSQSFLLSDSPGDLERNKGEESLSSKVKIDESKIDQENVNGELKKIKPPKLSSVDSGAVDSADQKKPALVKTEETDSSKPIITVEPVSKLVESTRSEEKESAATESRAGKVENAKSKSKEKKTKSSSPSGRETVEDVDRAIVDNSETSDDISKSMLSIDAASRPREAASPEPVALAPGSLPAGRIEQTRNYLKALTPERFADDEEKPKAPAAVQDTSRQDVEESKTTTTTAVDRDGKEHVWDTAPESAEGGSRLLENEDSDFTYRRKSMDEFIKKILAEAREESQKVKEDTEKAKKPPSVPTATARAKPQTPAEGPVEENGEVQKKQKTRKTKNTDIQLTTIDVDKELEEINKYFARRNDNLDGDQASEEKKKPSPLLVVEKKKAEKELLVRENGYLVKEAKPTSLDDDLEEKEFLLKPKNKPLTNFNDFEDEHVLTARKSKPAVTATASSATVKKLQQRTSMMNGDANFGKHGGINHDGGGDDDDDGSNNDISDFLLKFKRERQALFGGSVGAGKYDVEPKRSAETEELIRERTRNMRSVIDQQKDICQNVRSVSKQLDDLEKELREVRQISLDRRGRMEALENAVNAEYKMYEIEHNAAVERTRDKKPLQKFTQEVKDQMIANIQQAARSQKKGDRYRGELLMPDDSSSTLKRRVGSVSSQAGLMDEQDSFFMSSPSVSPYHSLAPSRGRGTSSDRDSYLASFLTVDRRRDSTGGGSRSRLSYIDSNNDFDDYSVQSTAQHGFFTKPKSRASVATMDTSTNISADDFLAKIRSKYSFLNPSLANDDSSSRLANATRSSGSSSGYRPSSSHIGGIDSSARSRLEEPSSTSSYLTVKGFSSRGASPNSYDVAGNRYSVSSIGRYSGLAGLNHSTSPSGYEATTRTNRASSVADVRSSIHYDRHLGGYTALGSSSNYSSGRIGSGVSRFTDTHGYGSHQPYSSAYSSSSSSLSTPAAAPATNSYSTGGEFKSRFLDKVREKRSSVGGGTGSSSHDLADRVRARLSGSSTSTASYDLPAPPSSTPGAQVSISVNSQSAVETKLEA